MWQFNFLLISLIFVTKAGAESTWTNCKTVLTTKRNSTDLHLNVEKHFELEFTYCTDSLQETFLINNTDGLIEVRNEGGQQLTELLTKNCAVSCVQLQFHLQENDHKRLVGYLSCSDGISEKYETDISQCNSENIYLHLKAEGELETCDNQGEFDPKSCLPEEPEHITLTHVAIGFGSFVFFVTVLCTGLYFANRKYGWRVKLQRRTTWRHPVRRLLSLRSSNASSVVQGNRQPAMGVSAIESRPNRGTRTSGSNGPRPHRQKTSQGHSDNEHSETAIIALERSPGRHVSSVDSARSRRVHEQSSSSPHVRPFHIDDSDDQSDIWQEEGQSNSNIQNSEERFEIHVSRIDPPPPVTQEQRNEASCTISLKPLVLEFRSPSCLSLVPQRERTECTNGFQTLPHPKPGNMNVNVGATYVPKFSLHMRPRALLPHEIAERDGSEMTIGVTTPSSYPLEPPEVPRSPLPSARGRNKSGEAAGHEIQASKRIPSCRPHPSMQDGVYDHLWYPPTD